MINNINKSNCVRKKMTPWLIGLIGLIVIIAFFLFFRIGQNGRKSMAEGFFDKSQTSVNTPVANDGSYHQIVDIIRPAVVGISLPGAQPFLQGWGPNTLTMNCPSCGTAVTRQPGTPWQNIRCPNCGSPMVSPLTGGGQNQTGVPNSPQQGMCWWNCPRCQVGTYAPFNQGFCPRCPLCGNNMSALAGQSPTQASPPAQGQQQGWSVDILTMNCPNCGRVVTRQPGIPWQNINCPKCGVPMVSPLAQVPQDNNIQAQAQPT